jgi:trk system potassium uptake protein TrkH
LSGNFGKAVNDLRRWNSTFLNTVSITLMGIGAALLVPLITAFFHGEDMTVFAYPMIFCFLLGLPLFLLFGTSKDMKPADGLLLIFIVWGIAMTMGAVPYVLYGLSPVNGMFESVSGFTTTGWTVFSYLTPDDALAVGFDSSLCLDNQSRSILLWRSLTQWVGGIAIILIFISLLPILGFGGRMAFKNEVSGASSKKFSARMKDAAFEFCIVYAILSAILFIAFVIMTFNMNGIDIVDSLCITFSTISTGGFMPHGGDFSEPTAYPVYAQLLIMVFMFLGATNFYLHYQRIYRKKDAGYLKNSEFKAMLLIFAVAAVLLFLVTYTFSETSYVTHAKDVLFTVVSVGSSTSYLITDPFASGAWLAVPAALGFLALLALVGGSSASTAGGMKIGRIANVMRYLVIEMKRKVHPRAVFNVRVGDETLDDQHILGIYVVFILFMITMILGLLALLILEPGLTYEDSFMISLATVSNSGFIGVYVPHGSFHAFAPSSKALLSLMMWLGRLEIGTALLLFTPLFWKEIFRGRRKIRKSV